MAGLIINTGVVTLDVGRDGKEVGQITFNPEDISFRERFIGLMLRIPEIEKELYKKSEGLKTKSSQIEVIKGMSIPDNAKEIIHLEAELYKDFSSEIDNIFGSGTSQIVFGDCVTNAALKSFFDGIAPFVKSASDAKTGKYVKKNG